MNIYKYHTNPTQLLYHDRIVEIKGELVFKTDDGLFAIGDLDLRNTKITQLPKGLKVGGEIIGFKG